MSTRLTKAHFFAVFLILSGCSDATLGSHFDGGLDGDATFDVGPDGDAASDVDERVGRDGDLADTGADSGVVVELCDQIDNDLDGQVDEDCPCAQDTTQPCYDGPPQTRGLGSCEDGEQRCDLAGEFSHWGPCEGSAGPAGEDCSDGADNDCDGLTDCEDREDCGDLAQCCIRDCDGRQCGEDRCGGSCGSCDEPYTNPELSRGIGLGPSAGHREVTIPATPAERVFHRDDITQIVVDTTCVEIVLDTTNGWHNCLQCGDRLRPTCGGVMCTGKYNEAQAFFDANGFFESIRYFNNDCSDNGSLTYTPYFYLDRSCDSFGQCVVGP